MIEVKQLGHPSEKELAYWLNVGFEFFCINPASNYGYIYLTRGKVGDEKTQLQWYTEANDALQKSLARVTDLEIEEKDLNARIQELEADLVRQERNESLQQARADDLDRQLIALGEENERLRNQLAGRKKRFGIF